MLVELALEGMVEVGEAKSVWRSAKVWPVEGARPADPVLTAAWATVGEKERTAQSLVERLGKGLDDTLCDRLAERGILERRDDKVLGLFPRTRWPARDSSHEDAVRRALDDRPRRRQRARRRASARWSPCCTPSTAPTSRCRTTGVSDREVKKRAKQVADGQWAAKAVKDAVAAATAGTVAAVTAATSASSAAAASRGTSTSSPSSSPQPSWLPSRCLSARNPDSRTTQRGAAAVPLGQLELDRRHRFVGVGAS